MDKYPKSNNLLILCWVDLWSHILTFIAGTNITCLFDANIKVDAKSSALPEANFAMEFAVIGANKIISHQRDNDMWSISASLLLSKIFW